MKPPEAEPTVVPAAPADDAVIVRRPHFQLRGAALFFLISRRPFATLNPAEQDLWRALEQEASTGELTRRLGPSTPAAILRLLHLEVVTALPSTPAGRRRRVMVIEPHMDDAVLSVGGLMWQRRADCEFLIVTLATRSVGTTYRMIDRDYFDLTTISELRQAESALVARLLGGRHIALGLPEASLRYHLQSWTLEWFRRHQHAVFSFLEHAPFADEVAPWTRALEQAATNLQPDELWMPLGVGLHADHQLTRQACLELLRLQPGLAAERACRFYQDVPYAAAHPGHTAALVRTLEEAGARLEPELAEVTAEMPAKIQLLSHYASQWKTAQIAPRVQRCAQALGGPPGTHRELTYRVTSAPTARIDLTATLAGRETVAGIARELTPWLLRHRAAPAISLLLGVPVGRWEEDLRLLLSHFPAAHFTVETQAKFAAESERFTSPRISVRIRGDGWRWVVGAALPAVLWQRRPVVIISGRRSAERGRRLARLALRCDPVVAPTMSDFVLALQLATQHVDPRERARTDQRDLPGR